RSVPFLDGDTPKTAVLGVSPFGRFRSVPIFSEAAGEAAVDPDQRRHPPGRLVGAAVAAMRIEARGVGIGAPLPAVDARHAERGQAPPREADEVALPAPA